MTSFIPIHRHHLRYAWILLVPFFVLGSTLYVQSQCVFERTTSGTEDYTIPVGVTELTVEAVGANGAEFNSSFRGGTGGNVTATFSVTPGDVIRFIVAEGGTRTGSGAGGGGGSTAVINCGGSASNCDAGNGTLLIVAGGGGGASGNNRIGIGATTILGNGFGGSWTSGAGAGGGGINSAGQSGNGGDPIGGAKGSFNPVFTGLRGEGFSGGGQGTNIGGAGGGGGGYTGGYGASGASVRAVGGSNFVEGTAINVTNLAGVDGGATTRANGSVCILEQTAGLVVSLTASAPACEADAVTYTASATGAVSYTFFLDENSNGQAESNEILQSGNGNANTFSSNELTPGQVVSVVASDGSISGRAIITVPTPDDTESPVFSSCLANYSGELNLCDEYIPTAEKLGIVATDNCSGITISFSPALITTVGTTSVTATATDEGGNTATCTFDLTLAANPDKFTLTAVNDTFQTLQQQAISFTTADLISNDQVSNGANLEVQDVELLDPSQGSITQIDDNTYSFLPAANFSGEATLQYTLKLITNAVFLESTNHYYEYVSTSGGITWTAAKVAAENRNLLGLPGYLATITSQEENDLIRSIIGRLSWMGASDARVEREWRWVTGPEGEENGGIGRLFWQGGLSNGGPVNNEYNDWTFNEFFQTNPNDGGAGKTQDYAWIIKRASRGVMGSWNDSEDVAIPRGYVVEYGGINDCTPSTTSTANIIVDVQPDINVGAFITTWTTTTQDPSITIYTNPGLTYDYTIDWGDGTTDTNVSGNISHTYSNHSVVHTVKIAGTFPHFRSDNLNVDPFNAWQINSIEQWGTIQWATMDFMFNNCVNMRYNATDAPDLSNVTVTRRMFVNAVRLDANTDLSNWDMSNVENMSYMFLNANRFNGNIDNWDVSSMKTMEGAFTQARSFNRNIGSWLVGNVTNMNDVFNTASSFNQDIGGWNTSSVTTMNAMFIKASSFNQDISGWNVSNVLFMQGTFQQASSFNQDISNWNVGKVRNMISIFANARSFDQSLGSWNITGLQSGYTLLRALTGTAMSTANYDATLIGWVSQNVANNIRVGAHGLLYCAGREARQELIADHAWRFDGDALDQAACGELPFITTWTTTVSDPTITIYAPSATSYTYDYTVDWGDGNIDHNVNGDISHTYSDHSTPHTVQISGEFPGFIAAGPSRNDTENAKQLNSIEQWGSIKWQRLYSAFQNAENMVYQATDAPDLSELVGLGLRNMFFNAKSLESPDLNNWDVSKVTDMSSLFGGAKRFNGAISRWDVSNVRSILYMFYQAAAFNQDLSSWDVSNVTSMVGTFSQASSFNQPLDRWNVSKVTSMRFMFNNADNFNQPIGNWEVGNVINMESMFRNASSFNQSLGDWDLSGLSNTDPLEQILNNSGLDVANYDATLIGWEANSASFPSNLAVGVGVLNLSYCAGETARTNLINNKGWTFVGDMKDCLSPNATNDEVAARSEENPAAEQSTKTLAIYPNPTSGQVNIAIQEATPNSEVVLRDQLGRVLWKQVVDNEQSALQISVDVSQYPAGMYWVSLQSEEEVLTEKLIITK